MVHVWLHIGFISRIFSQNKKKIRNIPSNPIHILYIPKPFSKFNYTYVAEHGFDSRNTS